MVTDDLNFWGGKRVKVRQETKAEPVFEPATGNYPLQIINISYIICIYIHIYIEDP